MKIIISLFLALLVVANAKITEYELKPKNLQMDTFMNIKILDTKEISFQEKNNIAFTEISDITYKNGKFFAVGDKGVLYEMKLKIKSDRIAKLELIHATKLKDKFGKKLKKKDRDSEGLVFIDDKLALSFEGNERIDLYTTNGLKIKNLPIHKDLRKKKNYQGRNKGLEAVAYNEKYGIVTAPQEPLKDQKSHTIYSENKSWKFEAEGVITGLQFISKNKLLILLKEFDSLREQRVITLLQLNLKKCSNYQCQTKIIAKLDSNDGWNLDNFEGLTQVEKNKFLMISDDNGNLFQKTLLVLFEIVN